MLQTRNAYTVVMYLRDLGGKRCLQYSDSKYKCHHKHIHPQYTYS